MKPLLRYFKNNTEPFLKFEPELPKIVIIHTWLPFLQERKKKFEKLAQSFSEVYNNTIIHDFAHNEKMNDDEFLKNLSDVDNLQEHLRLHELYIEAYEWINKNSMYNKNIFSTQKINLYDHAQEISEQYIQDNLKYIVQFMAGKKHDYKLKKIRYFLSDDSIVISKKYVDIMAKIYLLKSRLYQSINSAKNALKAGEFVRSL